jgi:hypothetical protein
MQVLVWLHVIIFITLGFILQNYYLRAKEHLKREYKEKDWNILGKGYLFREDEAYEDEEGLMYRDKTLKMRRIAVYYMIVSLPFFLILSFIL